MPCGDLVVAAGFACDEDAPQDLSIARLQLLSANAYGLDGVVECCAHLTELPNPDDVARPKVRRV